MDIENTLKERRLTHGDYKAVSFVYDELQSAMLRSSCDRYSKEHALALDMICQKLARIACGDANFADHWHDIAGYASLAEIYCKKDEK